LISAFDSDIIQPFFGTVPYSCLIKCILSPGKNLPQIQNIFIITCSCSWDYLVRDVRQQNSVSVIQRFLEEKIPVTAMQVLRSTVNILT